MVSVNETNKIKKMMSMNAYTEHYKLLKMTLSEPGLQVLTRMKTHKHYLRRKAKNAAQPVSNMMHEDLGGDEYLSKINGNSTDAGRDDTHDNNQAEKLNNY